MESWASKYVGTPYLDRGRDTSGCDCWGLARLIFAQEFNIDLPSYDDHYLTAADEIEISALMRENTSPWERVETPEPSDIIQLRVKGLPCHVGVVVGEGQFIHIMQGIEAVVESYAGLVWRRRVVGFYRWRGHV